MSLVFADAIPAEYVWLRGSAQLLQPITLFSRILITSAVLHAVCAAPQANNDTVGSTATQSGISI